MRDELYIDGKKADIDSSTSISLNYKSNFLSDISKIVSNNSYTIKLPKTANNLRIIECAHIPSAVSNFPYLIHAGTLVRDGVEIIRDANVVLLSVGEQIEIALSWGNISNFSGILEDDAGLRDLDYGMSQGTDYVEWKNLESNTAQFPQIDYGYKRSETQVWYHPVVTVKWIIDKIASNYGITFDFPSDISSEMSKMIVPLLSRNDAQRQIDSNAWLMQCTGNEEVFSRTVNNFRLYRRRFMFGGQFPNYYVDFKNNEPDGPIGFVLGFNPNFRNVKVHISWSVTIKAHSSVPLANDININIVLFNPANYKSYSTFSPSEKVLVEDNGGVYDVYEFRFDIDEDAELIDDDQNPYDLSNYLEISTSEYSLIEIDSIDAGYMSFSPFSETIDLGVDDKVNSRFYFVPNLPDMKQIDFLKSIASMLGLFAMPSDRFTIKFVPFSTVVENKSNAVDWSNRLVSAYFDKTPQEMTYTLDDFAQHNRFLYKEDDSVSGNYDGDIVVDNQTLDYERDAVELPFAASGTRGGVAYIPIYSYNSDAELEYDDNVEPRILVLTEENQGVFKELDWDTLLDAYYSSYKEIVNKPRVIVEDIRLTSVELQMLDLSVPVYLSQYGSYWVIISVKTKKNDICEVKLLKM